MTNNLWHTIKHHDDDELYINKYYKFKDHGSGLTEASYMEYINFKFKVKDQRAVYKLTEVEENNLIFEDYR